MTSLVRSESWLEYFFKDRILRGSKVLKTPLTGSAFCWYSKSTRRPLCLVTWMRNSRQSEGVLYTFLFYPCPPPPIPVSIHPRGLLLDPFRSSALGQAHDRQPTVD